MSSVQRLLICLIPILLLWSCHQPEPLVVEQIQKNGAPSSLVLTGPLHHPDILVDGLSVFDPIRRDGIETDEEVVHSLFEFMSNEFFVWNAPIGEELGTYLYGYGYGLCHMQSKVLAALWHERGIKGRLVSWPRHTMAEAEVDGVWRLYDAQHHVDYSRKGLPVSFSHLKNNHLLIEDLDPVGYGAAYWHQLIENAEVEKDRIRKTLKKPDLSLQKGQQLVLRRRETNARFPLFSSEQPHTAPRSHLVPLFELALRHQFRDEQVQLHTRLPVLGISLEGMDQVKVRISGGASLEGDASEISTLLHGETRKLVFEAPAGSQLTVTYGLAAWCGNRLFGADTSKITLLAQRDSGTIAFNTTASAPLVRLGPLVQSAGDPQLFQATLSWENLHGEPLQYHLFFDELSSSFPLEVWRYLGRLDWEWRSEVHGASGQAVLPFRWKPGASSPYRPEKYGTVFFHGRGPHLRAGLSQAILHFDRASTKPHL